MTMNRYAEEIDELSEIQKITWINYSIVLPTVLNNKCKVSTSNDRRNFLIRSQYS